MGLLDSDLPSRLNWGRVRDAYEITKKPRSLDVSAYLQIPFAAMEAIPQGGQYAPQFTLKSSDQLTSGTYFERGDVLVAKITPSFENGKQAFVQHLPTPFGYATTEVVPLRAKVPGQDPRFLFFCLLHPDVRHYTAERMEGTTARQRVPDDVFLDLPFPRFDKGEQVAIADALELVQKGVDLCAKYEKTLRDLKSVTMRELFTRGLRGERQKETEIGPVPASWEARPLLDVGTFMTGGTPPKSESSFWQGPVPWVSGKDLKRNRLHDVRDHISEKAARDFSRIAPRGSILVLVRGMGLAKGFALSWLGAPMAFNQDLRALVPNDAVDGEFLMHALTHAGERMLRNTATAAHGTKRLTLDDLESFLIPVPGRAEQQEIVSILDALDRKIDLHRRKKAVLEELFKSLLHKLMTGDIRVADLDLSALLAPEPAPQEVRS